MDRRMADRTVERGARLQSLESYGPVFTHSPEAVLVSNLEGEISAANPAACALFGMTEAEICHAGRSGLADVNDTQLATLLAECRRQRSVRGELRLMRHDGSKFLAELSVAALADDTTFVFLREITGRKRAETARAEAEARYRRFFERNAIGTFQGRVDLKTGTLWRLTCNQQYAAILGYASPAEALAEPLVANFPSADAYRGYLNRLLRDGLVADYEMEARRKDGSPIWVQVSASLTREPDGRTALTEGTLLDITPRKQAEAALRESEQRLRFHVENSPMAVVEWDANFLVTRWAGGAERIFGWRAEETVGKPILDLRLIHEPDIPIVERAIARLTDGASRQVTSSNRNVTKDGRVIHCIWHNSALLDEHERMTSVLSLVLDDTARVEAEERLRAVLAEKERALATNQTLLREVHHRIKNNLQMVCDLLYLQAGTLDSDQAQTVLQEAYGRVFVIARLHEQLYRSLESGEIGLAEYLGRLIAGFESVYPQVRFCLAAPDRGLALDVDRAIHLGLIVNELVTNALKHAFPPGQGGEVHVRVDRVGAQVQLEVRDNGKGLPPGVNLEEAKSLGLRIVHILVRRLEGVLKIENRAGAAFILAFPLEGEPPVAPAD